MVEALGALVNLIVVECLREYIGSQGALELALGMLGDMRTLVVCVLCVMLFAKRKL